jgi:hypothetical protein
MKYVIASSTERILSVFRNALSDRPEVECRVGSVAEAGPDCDAAILSFPLAHERYGGSPQLGVTQILENRRDDGAPRIILATPPLPPRTPDNSGTDSDFEMYVLHVLNSCTAEFLKNFPDCGENSKILIHLEAAGIDRKDLGVPLKATLKFFSQSRPAES